MIDFQMAIVSAFIGAVLAFILFELKQKFVKNLERPSDSVTKVFEQIKANLEKLEKNVEKVQMQIDYHRELHHSEGHQNPVLELIQRHQAKIQESMAKVQVQIGKYGDILKLLHNTDCFKLKPIRKTIRFAIANCAELFKKQEFNVDSSAIEVLGFSWFLKAKTTNKKGFLGLFLYANPPKGFNGHYRIEVDYRISVLNAFRGKDLENVSNGRVYDKGTNAICHRSWGWNMMAKFEDLLDPAKGFLRADGSIEVEADFTIKSSTLDHLIG